MKPITPPGLILEIGLTFHNDINKMKLLDSSL